MTTEMIDNPRLIRGFAQNVDVVIASGATGLSGALDLKGMTPVAIQMPAAWVAADLTFQVSLDGGVTYANLYDEAGTEIAVTVAASRVVALNTVAKYWSGGWIKFRSGTAALAVDQTASRTLILSARLG